MRLIDANRLMTDLGEDISSPEARAENRAVTITAEDIDRQPTIILAGLTKQMINDIEEKVGYTLNPITL